MFLAKVSVRWDKSLAYIYLHSHIYEVNMYLIVNNKDGEEASVVVEVDRCRL